MTANFKERALALMAANAFAFSQVALDFLANSGAYAAETSVSGPGSLIAVCLMLGLPLAGLMSSYLALCNADATLIATFRKWEVRAITALGICLLIVVATIVNLIVLPRVGG